MSLIPNRLCIYIVSDEEKEFIMIREEIIMKNTMNEKVTLNVTDLEEV